MKYKNFHSRRAAPSVARNSVSQNNNYIIILFLYIIAYIYAIEFAQIITDCSQTEKKKKCGYVEEIHRSCIMKTKNLNSIIKQGRGNKYYINADNTDVNDCLITYWGLSHFCLYFLFGYFTPDFFWETFFLGIGFEFYEKYMFDCHDIFDIFLNTIGFKCGQIMQHEAKSSIKKLID